MKHGNKRIREMREKRGMSQIELAAAAGVTQAAISAIELGGIQNPTVDIAQKIASALNVDLKDIFPIEAA